jgi:hypothetical protein
MKDSAKTLHLPVYAPHHSQGTPTYGIAIAMIAVAWHSGHIFFLADPYGHHSRSRVSSDSNPSTAL